MELARHCCPGLVDMHASNVAHGWLRSGNISNGNQPLADMAEHAFNGGPRQQCLPSPIDMLSIFRNNDCRRWTDCRY